MDKVDKSEKKSTDVRIINRKAKDFKKLSSYIKTNKSDPISNFKEDTTELNIETQGIATILQEEYRPFLK